MNGSGTTGPGQGRERSFETLVGEGEAGERLDVLLAARLAGEGLSRSKIQSWIKEGLARVDGEVETRPKLRLAAGQRVELAARFDNEEIQGVPGDLSIIYEDEHLLVVDKPAGLAVHPAPGETGPTLVNYLAHRYPKLAGLDPERPGVVHRIDKDTTGLMAVALDEKTRLALARMFAERKVDKTYLAVCFGVPEPSGRLIEESIGRDPANPTRMAVARKGGREAMSEYATLWTSPGERFTLLAVKIFTGRTHQIRVHLAHIGHPLAGDKVYGPRENAEWAREHDGKTGTPPRQMLHSWKLGFDHPATGERMRFGVRPPGDFMDFLSGLAHEPLRVGIVGLPGSGKTTLAGLLAVRGAPVFSADAKVSELYRAGGDGAALISGRFGGRYNDQSGAVDKKALFHAMQKDDAVRREVMDLVHPLVEHGLVEFWRENAEARLAAAEVPLLMEAGWKGRDLVDLAVCVTAPEKARRGRLAMRRGWSEETVARMESWQWPQDKKAAACDIVVDNSGGLDQLEREADKLMARLMAEAEKRKESKRKELDRLTDPREESAS